MAKDIKLYFLLGKGDTELNNNEGFSLSEVIIAMGILMMLVATVLPIHQKITTEQYRMKHHQTIKHALHDELQAMLWTDKQLESYTQRVAERDVQMSFTTEGAYVKGCAIWENVREEKEKVCLHGIQEE